MFRNIFSTFFHTTFFWLLLIAASIAEAAPSPFNVTCVFTGTIGIEQLPKSVAAKPITIAGGVRAVEYITNGTISGPSITASVTGGLAVPQIYNNATFYNAIIYMQGVTDDGFPWYVDAEGVGNPEAQMARLTIDIGGGEKYAPLRTGYILGTLNANRAQGTVAVSAYLIQNTVQG